MELSALIRSKRAEKGYSQEYMAIKLNISQTAYSRIERKASNKPIYLIFKIAKILDINLLEINDLMAKHHS